jgi:hypothetical protein
MSFLSLSDSGRGGGRNCKNWSFTEATPWLIIIGTLFRFQTSNATLFVVAIIVRMMQWGTQFWAGSISEYFKAGVEDQVVQGCYLYQYEICKLI